MGQTPVAALRMGLPGTGPPSLVFGPPSLLAHQVFLAHPFYVFGTSSFVTVYEYIRNLYMGVILVY